MNPQAEDSMTWQCTCISTVSPAFCGTRFMSSFAISSGLREGTKLCVPAEILFVAALVIYTAQHKSHDLMLLLLLYELSNAIMIHNKQQHWSESNHITLLRTLSRPIRSWASQRLDINCRPDPALATGQLCHLLLGSQCSPVGSHLAKLQRRLSSFPGHSTKFWWHHRSLYCSST